MGSSSWLSSLSFIYQSATFLCALLVVLIFHTFKRFATRFVRSKALFRAKRNMNQPPRFPSTPADAKSAAQNESIAEAERVVLEAYGPTFKLRDENGALLGPFPLLMCTPETFVPYLRHTAACVESKHLSPRERELITLAVGSVTQASYVLYAHKKIGMSVGLSTEQATSAASGKTPSGLDIREAMLFDLALEMSKGYGKVGERSWKSGKQMFGLEGMAALTQLVGCYLHSSCLVNCAEIKVPDENIDVRNKTGPKPEQKIADAARAGGREKDWEIVESNES